MKGRHRSKSPSKSRHIHHHHKLSSSIDCHRTKRSDRYKEGRREDHDVKEDDGRTKRSSSYSHHYERRRVKYEDDDWDRRSSDRHRKSHHKKDKRKDRWNFFGYTEKDLDKAVQDRSSDDDNRDENPDDRQGRKGSRIKEDKGLHNVESVSKSSCDWKTSKNEEDGQDNVKGLFDWKYHRQQLDRLFFLDDDAVIKK